MEPHKLLSVCHERYNARPGFHRLDGVGNKCVRTDVIGYVIRQT